VRRDVRIVGAGAAAAVVVAGLTMATSASAAEVRYAEPDSAAPHGAAPCSQADPCDIQVAVETVAQSGDEVVVLPGDYMETDTLTVSAGIDLHGEVGQPRPRIVSTASEALFVIPAAARVSDLSIEHTGSASALSASGGTFERLFVHATASGGPFATACNPTDVTIRDSVCWNTAPSGGSGLDLNLAGGSSSVTLRNVTAVASAPDSVGIKVRAVPAQLTLEGKNVIAKGGTDIAAMTDSSGGASATLNLDYSNFATRSVEGTNASATEPGTLNNQTAAPLFVNAAAGDFHQAPGSPTIDAGTTDVLLGSLDIDREARIQGSAPDIGADEFVPPGAPDGPAPEPLAKADRTLTLDANKGKVEKGRKVRLTGQIDAPASEAACEPNQTVELQRKAKRAPDTAFSTFDSVQTDAAGNFADKVKVKKTRIYRAQVQETEACDDELSNTQKVRVQKPNAAKEA
jgi:hypothetical protein